MCRLLVGTFTTAFEAGAINLLGGYYLGDALHKRLTLFLSTRLIASSLGGVSVNRSQRFPIGFVR